MTRALLVLSFLLVSACYANRERTRADLGAAADAVAPTSIQELAWLVGAWRGDGLGGKVDEVWSAPEGGTMVGHFRLVRGGAVAFYEIMTIGPVDAVGTLGLKVKHFAPDLTGWEEQDAWVTFLVRSIDGGVVDLDGARIERVADDRMDVTVTMRSPDGSSRDEVLRYQRLR